MSNISIQLKSSWDYQSVISNFMNEVEILVIKRAHESSDEIKSQLEKVWEIFIYEYQLWRL